MRLDAAAGIRRARLTEAALRRLSFQLSGAQLGITVTSLAVGFLAEPTVAAALEPIIGEIVGEERVRGVSIATALVLATLVQMVVSELIPKSYAIAKPGKTAYALAPPMVVLTRLAGPVITLFNESANWTVRRLGIEPREELASVRSLEELELLFRSSGEEGNLDPEVFALLRRSLRFRDKAADDAMVPRVAVVAVAQDDSAADPVARSIETGHSRFPVIGGDLDDLRGVVHVKDAFRVPFESRVRTPVAELMSPPVVVPEAKPLEDLLVELRRQGSHLAVVVDEYGGTAGVITLEDVLEEIVGEIDDEHDPVAPDLTEIIRPGEWEVDGTLHPDEVFDACGLQIPEGEYETIAGFVLQQLGRIPRPGDGFMHERWRIEVAAMDGLRIGRVRLVNRAEAVR